MSQFKEPAVLIGKAEAFQSASWRPVPRRRKEWLRALTAGDEVNVVDDFGKVYSTTVRGMGPPCNAIGSLEPQVWLLGHNSCYAAARMYRPGKAPITMTTDERKD